MEEDVICTYYITQKSIEENLNTSGVPSNKLDPESANQSQNMKADSEDRTVLTISGIVTAYFLEKIFAPEKKNGKK